MSLECLKLNKIFMPVDIINWEEAVTLWAAGKAEIISAYEDKIIHTGNRFTKPNFGAAEKFMRATYDHNLESWKTAMNMPSVIRLFEFVTPKKQIKFFESFTRKNIFERDKGICQYCGKQLTLSNMTMDHVIAKSRGGKSCWTNIVCCCLKCNSKKDNQTLEECEMKLIRKPYAPIIADNFQGGIIKRLKGMTRVINNQQWRDYIYFNVELEQD